MRLMLSTLLVALSIGCGVGPGSPLVGGECSSDRDCEKRCTMEDDFGTGMCTVGCANDQECPEGTACVDKAGGVCAVSCRIAGDCAGFGRAYTCKQMKRASGGDTLVCRLP